MKPIIDVAGVDVSTVDAGSKITFDEMNAAIGAVATALKLATGHHVDTGIGFGQADLWIKYRGREFHLVMRAKPRTEPPHD